MSDIFQKELERLKKNPFEAVLHHSDSDSAILSITIPPSDNRYYKSVNNRKVLSKEGREYKKMQ